MFEFLWHAFASLALILGIVFLVCLILTTTFVLITAVIELVKLKRPRGRDGGR